MDASTQLSPNYTVGDLVKTSTGLPNMPPDDSFLPNLTALAHVLELLRSRVDTFTIASGYRSPAVNAAVAGASDSFHSDGIAADIYPDNITNQEFWHYIHNTPSIANSVGEYIFYPLSHGTIHVSAATAQKQSFPLAQVNGVYSSKSEDIPAFDDAYNLDANPDRVPASLSSRTNYVYLALGLAVILGVVVYVRRNQ